MKKSAIAEQNRKRDIESSRDVVAALRADRHRGAGAGAVAPPASKVPLAAGDLCCSAALYTGYRLCGHWGCAYNLGREPGFS